MADRPADAMAKPFAMAAVVLPTASRVGAVAHLLGQARHLGDAARVVGNRAVRVDADGDGRVGEHARRGKADAEQANRDTAFSSRVREGQVAERVSADDGEGDQDDRGDGGKHARADAPR